MKNKIFSSLTTPLMLFWMPYNFALLLLFVHLFFMVYIWRGSVILPMLSLIIFSIIGILKTKKDPKWFSVVLSTIKFYTGKLVVKPFLIFRRRVRYNA